MPTSRLDLGGSAKALLDAVMAISSELDLNSVLDRIVVSACDLTGARYGALGVLGPAGGLSEFITSGLSDEERQAIGPLPRGHGILGLLIDRPEPLRIQHLKEHPASYGFPANHPPMDRFLGVPVRTRGKVFGNLYLTDKQDGQDFTEQDELLVQALATAAGFVIDNARAYARSERQRQWLEATAQITEALQVPGGVDAAMSQIAISARRVADADAVAIATRSPDGAYRLTAVDGARAVDLAELVHQLQDGVVEAQQESEMVVMPLGGVGERTAVLVPLRAQLAGGGVLVVVLAGRSSAIRPEDTDLLISFADQASLALDRAQALNDRQELMLVSDRDRIARDLHDLVIQRLFATGLHLQGVSRIAISDEVRERIDSAVSDLDVTIRDIRSTIFELQRGHRTSLRADIRGVVREYTPVLGFTPLVRTEGPVDTTVSPGVGEQLLAVLREALSNVARHAEAKAAVVEVAISNGDLLLRVTDDGAGLPPNRTESGLRNVQRRALELGGAVRLLPQEPRGTMLEWKVPVKTGNGERTS